STAPTWPRCRSCWGTTSSPPPCVTPTSANSTCNAPSAHWILCRVCPPPTEATSAPTLPGRRSHPRPLRRTGRTVQAERRAAPRRGGSAGLPHDGIGRADRRVLLLRGTRASVQLLPQSPLPQVPGRLPRLVVGPRGGLSAAGGIPSPGLHPT